MTHRSLIVLATALACVTVAAAPAAADTPTRSATIELAETASGSSKSVVFTLALVDDGSSSSLESHTSDGLYVIKVRREARRKGAAPTLIVELSRHDAAGATSLSMHATTTAAVGTRAVLLDVKRGDGTRYEVAATVN